MHTYLGGGYVYEINVSNSIATLQKMDWIDRRTAAVFVEFTLYNPNLNLYQHCMILFEILSAGTFINTAEFYSVDLTDINSTGLLSFKILICIVYMLFICIFMIVELRHLLKVGARYFVEFYNYVDLIIIGFSWAAFSMFLYRLYSAYDLNHLISHASTIGMQSVFINMQYISACDKLLNYFLGFCAAFATLRLIKLFRFNKRIIVFLVALRNSLNEFVSFSVIFVISWLSFVQAFYILLNDQMAEFASISYSMKTSFQLLLGKSPTIFTISSNLVDINPSFYAFYMVTMLFVLINVFITIMNENFAKACKDTELDKQDPALFTYLKSSVNSFLAYFNSNQGENKEPTYISSSELVEQSFEQHMSRLHKVFV